MRNQKRTPLFKKPLPQLKLTPQPAKFHTALEALRQCTPHFNDPLPNDESLKRTKLIKLCSEIAIVHGTCIYYMEEDM
jgi:hypothetical protein